MVGADETGALSGIADEHIPEKMGAWLSVMVTLEM
jgi:hypothetical protein